MIFQAFEWCADWCITMKTLRVMGIRRVLGKIMFVHHFAAEFCLNRITTQPNKNLADITCWLFHKTPRPKSAVSPRTKKATELIKINTHLKIIDAMFAAQLPESEIMSKTIQKRAIWLRDELTNNNPLAKLKKTP